MPQTPAPTPTERRRAATAKLDGCVRHRADTVVRPSGSTHSLAVSTRLIRASIRSSFPPGNRMEWKPRAKDAAWCESQPHLPDHGDAPLQFATGRKNRYTLFQDGEISTHVTGSPTLENLVPTATCWRTDNVVGRVQLRWPQLTLR